jgi:hypothetical protein
VIPTEEDIALSSLLAINLGIFLKAKALAGLYPCKGFINFMLRFA